MGEISVLLLASAAKLNFKYKKIKFVYWHLTAILLINIVRGNISISIISTLQCCFFLLEIYILMAHMLRVHY